MFSKEIENRLQELKEKIKELSKSGYVEKSLEYYRNLVELLREHSQEDTGKKDLLIEMLNQYGGALRYTGYYDESEKAFIQAKELIEENYGTKNENYGTTLNNLAGLYRLSGKLDEAIKLFNEVKLIYESTVGEDTFLYASLCNNLALAWQDKGNYEEAYKLYIKSLAYLTHGRADERIIYAITLNNIIEPCKRLGRKEEINDFLKTAKKIVIEEDKSHMPLYATILNNQGTEAFDSEDYHKALEYFVESHAILKNTYGEKSPYYVYSLENLKQVYEHLGNKEKIKEIEEEIDNG